MRFGSRKAFFPVASALLLATLITGCGLLSRPRNPAVSLTDAIEIAATFLESHGIEATFGGHSGMDWEWGRWVWEITFRDATDRRLAYEFYIDVNTGEIVKFETEFDN